MSNSTGLYLVTKTSPSCTMQHSNQSESGLTRGADCRPCHLSSAWADTQAVCDEMGHPPNPVAVPVSSLSPSGFCLPAS